MFFTPTHWVSGIFFLPDAGSADSTRCMIRRGFLDRQSRKDLIELARDGSAAHRLARRANALVLLDGGMSCAQVAHVLLLDDDTVRNWHRLYLEDGIEGLAGFGFEGSECRLNEDQQARLKAWVSETLPRSAGLVGAYIAREFGIEYQSKSAVIALLHRLGMEHRRPKALARQLNPAKQAEFIKKYEDLLNQMGDDEVVLFGDAVHPIHGAQPVGCWAPKDANIAVPQTTRRQGMNIHGALDLETGKTAMVEALSVDAESTIRLLILLQAMYPRKRIIHLFLDNARYHHAKKVQDWLAQPGCRIKLHFIPSYCPHLNPIERLWGLMHKHTTHNKCHPTFNDFASAVITFLRCEVTQKWHQFRDRVTDNFRIIDPANFRVIA
jgi:transposase